MIWPVRTVECCRYLMNDSGSSIAMQGMNGEDQ